MEIKKPTIGECSKEGVKVNYTKIRNAINRCEVEMVDKKSRDECKKIFKELNINIFED